MAGNGTGYIHNKVALGSGGWGKSGVGGGTRLATGIATSIRKRLVMAGGRVGLKGQRERLHP